MAVKNNENIGLTKASSGNIEQFITPDLTNL